ncbi:hypothetical protein M011DRAFT_40351 [Sporormia fimetaria CBS 119925]|uniref:Uncharacterized protein n=1 Tax=Sporormia fimetaria CBS 119925 TaxID=1340428 RepID=A0A6A6VB88_9PLEO|nr:hypothetical protein M011DRAFT_40351 [Sporormia fimetaria CBS 119925]
MEASIQAKRYIGCRRTCMHGAGADSHTQHTPWLHGKRARSRRLRTAFLRRVLRTFGQPLPVFCIAARAWLRFWGCRVGDATRLLGSLTGEGVPYGKQPLGVGWGWLHVVGGFGCVDVETGVFGIIYRCFYWEDGMAYVDEGLKHRFPAVFLRV